MNHHPSIAQPQERNIALKIDPKCTPRKRHHRDIVGKLSPLHFTRLSNEPQNPSPTILLFSTGLTSRFLSPISQLRKGACLHRIFSSQLPVTPMPRSESTVNFFGCRSLDSTFYFLLFLCPVSFFFVRSMSVELIDANRRCLPSNSASLVSSTLVRSARLWCANM